MNRTRGITFAILAAFIYGFTPILAKFTYMGGSNTISLTFYRSLLSLPALYAILKVKRIPIKVTKSELKKLSILSILGPCLTGLMLYGSYNYISVGMTTTIHYIYPILVTVSCVVFFNEKISAEKIFALLFSTIGILLFFEGDFSNSIIGILLALFSGIAYGGYLLFIDKSGIKGMYPFKISFYTCLFSSIFLFVYGMAKNQLIFEMSPIGWLFTFFVSIFVSVIANTFMPIAINNVGSTVTAILGMFEPITSVVLGILFLEELCTFKIITGCTFIIIAVLILTLSKEKKIVTNLRSKKDSL